METTIIKNETTVKTERQSLIKVKDEVLIYINDQTYIKFTKVFQFPGSPNAFIGHINIWDDNAPFYILYSRECLRKLSIKGYNKCLFIPNSFIVGFDKNNKMYLRCVTEGANSYLKYYPITNISDMRNLVELRKNGAKLYAGFSKSRNLPVHGECFHLISNTK